MAATVMEIYGSKVFNEHEMRERLPSSTYKSLKATIEKGQPGSGCGKRRRQRHEALGH